MMDIKDLNSRAAAICILHCGEAVQSVTVIQQFTDEDPHGKHTADCSFLAQGVVFKINGRLVSTGTHRDQEELLEELQQVLEREVILSTPKETNIPFAQGNKAFQSFSQTLYQAS